MRKLLNECQECISLIAEIANWVIFELQERNLHREDI